MTEQTTPEAEAPGQSTGGGSATDQGTDAGSDPGSDPVRKVTLVLLVITVLLIVWYLISDRITPFTTQAKVHALVVPVAAEVSGTVTTVAVTGNQSVAEGDVLFVIDRGNYEFALENAEAALQTARQGTGASSANVDAARAALGSAQAALMRAELDADRLRRIKQEDPGAISDRRLESAEASHEIAREQVSGAKANLERALQDRGETGDDNAMIRQAKAGLDQARLNLERTTVRAPGAGLVTDVRVDVGNFAPAGNPQMIFIATGDGWVRADLTENNLGHVDVGDAAEVAFDVFPGRVFDGRVRSIGFGVSVDSAPLGSLPTIQNDREWLRDAQRFPVEVVVVMPDTDDRTRMRVGAQASVIVYATDSWLFNALGALRIRILSLLSYAY